ncbi:Transcriptional regulator, AraC family [Desulfosporosinus sp. I2]|nr:Transcriptional regulator, AraC family [Desulfosporosinus sp. I2]
MDNKIICEHRTYTDVMKTHDHRFVQLILPLQGVLNIRTDAKELKLDEGHLFLLPPSCQHTFWAKQNNKFLVLDIPQFMFQLGELDNFPGGQNYEMDEKWKAIRFLLLSEVDQDEIESSRISSLFHYFNTFLTEYQIPDSVKYIQQFYNEEISLEKLASLEHYTVNYFCSWFKGIMNCTPMAYLKRVRIQQSKQLLLETSLNILQIAWEVGYVHQSSLNRVFKEIEGITPAEYRRNNMKIS